MSKIHTHYDNLKVTRNAPPEVIRAAYKTLSQKYHPDRFHGNAQTTRVMSIINASYTVLSDPIKRQEHDLWIAEKERSFAHQVKQNIETQQKDTPLTPTSKSSISGIVTHILRHWFLYGIAIFCIWLWDAYNTHSPQSNTNPIQKNPMAKSQEYVYVPIQKNPMAKSQEYVRPKTAPNGMPWPASAGYVAGYESLQITGLSSVTVDNSQNDSDVFVKMFLVNDIQNIPVRQIFIPAFGSFTMKKVSAGHYDIRYRDLSDGSLSRSESFHIEETATHSGTQFNNITMTLYKVRDGNMQTYELTEEEF